MGSLRRFSAGVYLAGYELLAGPTDVLLAFVATWIDIGNSRKGNRRLPAGLTMKHLRLGSTLPIAQHLQAQAELIRDAISWEARRATR